MNKIDRFDWLSILVNYRLLILLSSLNPITLLAQVSSADFEAPTLICEGLEYEFNNTSTVVSGDTATYQWYFQDAQTEISSEPYAIWSQNNTERTVEVKLVMYLQNGDSSIASKNVVVKRRPLAKFESSDYCEGDMAVFINKSMVSNLESIDFSWYALLDSNYRWPLQGNTRVENVTLLAIYDNGCADTAVKAVTIYTQPIPEFSFQSHGDSVEFTADNQYDIMMWLFLGGGLKLDGKSVRVSKTVIEQFPNVCLQAKSSYCWGEYCEDIPSFVSVLNHSYGNFKFYPNPSSGQFTIESNQINELKLMTLEGRDLLLVYTDSGNGMYKVSTELAVGSYLLQINIDGTIIHKRLVIRR